MPLRCVLFRTARPPPPWPSQRPLTRASPWRQRPPPQPSSLLPLPPLLLPLPPPPPSAPRCSLKERSRPWLPSSRSVRMCVSVRLSSHAAPSLGPSQVLSRPLLSPRGEGRSAPCSTGTLPNGTGGERPSQQGGQARCGARHAPHLAHARSLAGSMSPAGPPAGGGAAPAGQRGGGSTCCPRAGPRRSRPVETRRERAETSRRGWRVWQRAVGRTSLTAAVRRVAVRVEVAQWPALNASQSRPEGFLRGKLRSARAMPESAAASALWMTGRHLEHLECSH